MFKKIFYIKTFYVIILMCFFIKLTNSFTRELNPHYGGFGPGYLTVLPNGQYGDGEIRSPQQWPSFGLKGVGYGTRWNCKIYTNRNGTKWTSDLTTSAGITINAKMLFPKAALTYTHNSLPIQLSSEIFCPFLPADSKMCSLPVIFFDFKLKNTDSVNIETAIAFAIPKIEPTTTAVLYEGSNIKGLKINCSTNTVGSGSFIGLIKNDGTATTSWGSNFVDGQLNNSSGNMIASKIILAPNEERHIVFIFVWYFPQNYSCTRHDGKHIGGDHYYMNFYTSGEDMANDCYNNYNTIKYRLDRWFNNLMNSNLPDWMKELISVNNIPLVYNSCFFKSGIAALVESYDYNMTGTYDHQFYLSIGQLIFIPDAEWGEVKYFAEIQSPTGGIRHDTGGWNMSFECIGTDDDYGADPDARDTWGDLTPKWLLNVYRDYLWTGNITNLTALWPNIKEACR
jgi:uncharacterized protein (DUF608 family)